jgi:carbonic anhydrase
MDHASPLPDFLVARFRRWRARMGPGERERMAALAERGQNPRAMIVACCDSRVMATDVFGGEAGDFFVHRNIANLVPRHTPDGAARGTSATIEYAVGVLKVEHLIVMGHFGCGGVAGCHDLQAGVAGAPAADSFVGQWLRILAPGYDRIAALGLDRTEALRALEREAILVSLENLMTFPFVREAVAAGRLALHGIWKDISDGDIEWYDPASDRFRKVDDDAPDRLDAAAPGGHLVAP